MPGIPALPESMTFKTWQIILAGTIFMAGVSSAYYWSDLVTNEDHATLAKRVAGLEQGQQEYANCVARKLNQMLEQFDYMREIWRQIETIKAENRFRIQMSKSTIYSQRPMETDMKEPIQSGRLINILQFNECKFKIDGRPQSLTLRQDAAP